MSLVWQKYTVVQDAIIDILQAFLLQTSVYIQKTMMEHDKDT